VELTNHVHGVCVASTSVERAPAVAGSLDYRDAPPRRPEVTSAGTPDPVRKPSELVDHQALIALHRQGAALESEPGGQKLGALVHAVLATLPPNRADLVEEFVRYVADQQELDVTMHRRAVELVRAALANESVCTAFSGSNWREVPFAKAGRQAW